MTQAVRRPPKPALTLAVLAGLAVCLFLYHLGLGGSAQLTPLQVAKELWRGPADFIEPNMGHWIVWHIRLPRSIECFAVGGILGVAGSVFQAQLRNPLADPYVIGVSSGASVGGAIALLLGWELAGFGRPLSGFLAGMATLLFVLALARQQGVLTKDRLILSGVLVGSQLSAVLSVVLLAAGQDTNKVLYWLLGDMSHAEFAADWALLAILLVGTMILLSQARRLNALAYGESTARSLGVNVNGLTYVVLITGTAMTAVTVGTVGIIGFLGLVAPHVARRLVGVDWRWSLPGSLVCGAILLCASDLVAQRGLSLLTHSYVIEPPVGIVTAILGAPVLMYLLKRKG